MMRTQNLLQALLLLLLLCIALYPGAVCAQIPAMVAAGPDGRLKVSLQLDEGKLFYQVNYDGMTFLEPSPLGLKTSLGDLSQGLVFQSLANNTIDESYTLHNAKTSQVDYQANELVCHFTQGEKKLACVFRVSNHDVAFSYRIEAANDKTNVMIHEELTGFDLPAVATSYLTAQALPMSGWCRTKPSYEEQYQLDQPLGSSSEYGVGYTFPALFKIGQHGWALISETGVDSRYVGSRLGESNPDGLFMLVFPLPGENDGIGETCPTMQLPAQTPWRTITVGKTLKPIVESTVAFDVVKPLYQPSVVYKMGRATWSWIMWQDGSINDEDQIKYIDLAAGIGLEYVLVDNWWDNNIGRERIVELVQYANARNVDVILWYNSNGWWNDAPQTPQDRMNTAPARRQEMKWLQSIGVKGLKVDFFGGDKQITMKLYEDILTDANAYGLAITFHGCTLPRGWERMYPNFVTSEAVMASEMLYFHQHMQDRHALRATILPFTRNAVGAMDFAPVFFNHRFSRDQKGGTTRRTTDAFELATAVLYVSPVQHFGITPNNLDDQPDYVWDFLSDVPAVWDQVVYISGEPGDHCVIARRDGVDWYIAAVNGIKDQQVIQVNLPMLAGQEVEWLFDQDDRTVGRRVVQVPEDGQLVLDMAGQGGAVISPVGRNGFN